MPELPEVERTRRLLHDCCCTATITQMEPEDTKIIQTPALLKRVLPRTTIQQTGRHGKWLWFDLDNFYRVYIHLGMTGWIQYMDDSEHNKQYPSSHVQHVVVTEKDWPPRFTKVHFDVLHPQNGIVKFAYTDPRRLGKIHVLPYSDKELGHPAEAPILDLAPDAWLDLPPLDRFHSKLTASNRPLKSILLDQRDLVSGIGNWVCDDVILEARLHPLTTGSALDLKESQQLREAIRTVVDKAVDVNGDSNRFPAHWLFHYRWDRNQKRTKSTKLGPMAFLTVGGRTTAVIPSLQKIKAANWSKDEDEHIKIETEQVGVEKEMGRKSRRIKRSRTK